MRRLAGSIFLLLFLIASPGQAADAGIVGKPAPDFSGTLVSGEPLSLSRFLGKGPVVLAFWSVYCKACIDELSALQRLYDTYGPEKLSVIGVNGDGDAGIERVRGFLERFPQEAGRRRPTFPVLFDGKGEVLGKYSVARMPTLIYIGKDGIVRESIEGFERGKEYSVVSAIEKLIDAGAVAPGPLRETGTEVVYDLDAAVPICGTYRDGKWYRPLDLDESGKPEAVARARAEGEEHLRREAIGMALSELGISLSTQSRPPGCFAGYGMEIRTRQWRRDALDMLIERLSFPRLLEVLSQETVERERELVVYRRMKVRLDVMKSQLDSEGYTSAKSSIRLRFVRATRMEERTFLDAVETQFPYLSRIEKSTLPRGGAEYLLLSHAPADRVIEKLRGLDVGPPKLSVELLSTGIAEVAMWR